MKNMLKNLLFSFSLLCFIACNDQKENDTSEQAYQDYKSFVEETESNAKPEYTKTESRAMRQAEKDSITWQDWSEKLKREFQARMVKVNENRDSYDQAKQDEIQSLENRFNESLKVQQENYDQISKRYKLREQLLGLKIEADDLSDVEAEELAQTYTHFTSSLERIIPDLSQEDWQLVEGWWVALNNRKRTLEPQLTQKDEKTIDQAMASYKALREKYANN